MTDRKPRVLIVCDDVGLGHVMRMRALREALEDQGAIVTVTNADPAIPNWTWDIAVIDAYIDGLVQTYVMEGQGRPVAVVDDFDRDMPGAALAIRPAELQHALIRREIREAYTDEDDGSLCVTFGRSMPGLKWQATIVSMLRDTGCPWPVVTDWPYPKARVVLTAGGVTALEAAHLGRPQVVLSLAINQARQCEALHAAGAAMFVPRATPGTLATEVARIMGDAERRAAMGAAGRAAVDGKGADRVARAVLELVKR